VPKDSAPDFDILLPCILVYDGQLMGKSCSTPRGEHQDNNLAMDCPTQLRDTWAGAKWCGIFPFFHEMSPHFVTTFSPWVGYGCKVNEEVRLLHSSEQNQDDPSFGVIFTKVLIGR
jgi:hypothetical protein